MIDPILYARHDGVHPASLKPEQWAALIGGPDRLHRERATKSHELVHATDFSREQLLRHAPYIVEQAKGCPELWPELQQATTEPVTWEKLTTGRKSRVGRDRMQGDWAAAALAWGLSSEVQIQTWVDNNQHEDLWLGALGFERIPSRTTAHDRLLELELVPEAFERAAATCWRIAQERNPQIGRFVWIDGDAYESHSRAVHLCCQDELDEQGRPVRRRRPRKYLERVPLDQIKEQRKKDAEKAPEEVDADLAGATFVPIEELDLEEEMLEELKTRLAEEFGDEGEDEPDVADELELPHPKYEHRRLEKPERIEPRVALVNGHYYGIRDGDAGFRAYNDKHWLGGTKLRACEMATGAEIASVHVPADRAEHHYYPVLLAKVKEILGHLPEAVIVDRGFSTYFVRWLSTLLGVAVVGPWRKPNPTAGKRSDIRSDLVDEYGFYTCEFCGSPTTTRGTGLGFTLKHGYPEHAVRCANPHTSDCERTTQYRRCEEAPMLAGVLTREDPLYFELRAAGKPGESVHNHHRARYRDAGDNQDTRAKRLGLPFMRLRAVIADFLDIFRVCLRYGWVGSHANVRPPLFRQRKGGKEGVAGVRQLRRRLGLLVPRGPKALALGLAFDGTTVPAGWIPIAERKKRQKAAATKARKKPTTRKPLDQKHGGPAKPPTRGRPKKRAP